MGWGKKRTQWRAQLNSNWLYKLWQTIWRIAPNIGSHSSVEFLNWAQVKLQIRAIFFRDGVKNGSGKGWKVIPRRSESNPWLTALPPCLNWYHRGAKYILQSPFNFSPIQSLQQSIQHNSHQIFCQTDSLYNGVPYPYSSTCLNSGFNMYANLTLYPPRPCNLPFQEIRDKSFQTHISIEFNGIWCFEQAFSVSLGSLSAQHCCVCI